MALHSAVLSVSLLAAGEASAGDLTSTELKNELVGRSIAWWEDGGWRGGSLILAPDGSAEITIDRSGANSTQHGDKGRWALRNGELCTVWSEIREGGEKCYSVRRGERGRFVTSGGNVFEIRDAGV
ncbi:hypothetical protein [Mesorhizobium retamae]|uniref:Uncharacterized protein n=1 Tax=Mesorhizobium retamae TaxID=2912854 RepID=A0ABS9QCL2_9HYPH|nr:hypothetical protein [Mesorhizobium sp. IRAMC:0171]MCG7504546.1 hypothetical protein [Mesorhizobium sp. IRAMC:0171]